MKLPPLTPEQQALVADNLGLARAVANRFTNLPPGLDPDDVASAAMAGLCRAAMTYNPAGGAKFSTYGWTGAWNAATRLVRAERGGAVRVPVHRTDATPAVAFSALRMGEDVDFAGTVAQAEADPREESPDAVMFWEAIDEGLPNPRERLVLRRRFRDGWQLDRIAEELGLSKERIRQIEVKALAALAKQPQLFGEWWET